MPQNPDNIFVAMLSLLAFASPAQAELIDHTYWAYVPNPPPFIVGCGSLVGCRLWGYTESDMTEAA